MTSLRTHTPGVQQAHSHSRTHLHAHAHGSNLAAAGPSSASAAATAAAVAAFPWPFVYPPPAAAAAAVAVPSSSADPAALQPASASGRAPSSTPNFDAILAHVACSSSSPLVRANVGPHAPNGAQAGAQRVRGLDLLWRSRAEGVRSAWEEMERQQRRWAQVALLHAQVGEAVARLHAAHPQPPPAPASAAQSYGAAAADNQTALVGDLATLWTLAQAEPFLLMDPESNSVASHGATTAGAAAAAEELGLFGLDWATLSGAFRPASSAIPLGPRDSSSSSHSSLLLSSGDSSGGSARAHCFATPSSSALQVSLEGLLLPEAEAALAERVDALWNDFDPLGEERAAEEELAAAAAAAAAAVATAGASSASTAAPADAATKGSALSPLSAEETAPFLAGLPPLDSSDLPSLVAHRQGRVAALEFAICRAQTALARQESARHSALSSSLQLSAALLAGQVPLSGSSSAEPSRSQIEENAREYLREKLRVLARKMDKVAAEMRRDTYLGLAQGGSASASAGAAAAASASDPGSLILPSLRVVSQTLQALRSQKSSERSEKAATLARYQSLGPDFRGLAAELEDLERKIENKKWTLQKLH